MILQARAPWPTVHQGEINQAPRGLSRQGRSTRALPRALLPPGRPEQRLAGQLAGQGFDAGALLTGRNAGASRPSASTGRVVRTLHQPSSEPSGRVGHGCAGWPQGRCQTDAPRAQHCPDRLLLRRFKRWLPTRANLVALDSPNAFGAPGCWGHQLLRKGGSANRASINCNDYDNDCK